MQATRKDIAVRAFEELDITGLNRALADYWLSLWDGDRLPKRRWFQPGAVPKLLPGIGIFSVKPGVSAYCRLAGTSITRALGRDLTGKSWRDYTPPDQLALRLERNSRIASGGVGIGVRISRGPAGHLEQTTELQLPFADEAEDGTRQLLFHLDWRAPEFTPRMPPSGEGPDVANSFRAIALN